MLVLRLPLLLLPPVELPVFLVGGLTLCVLVPVLLVGGVLRTLEGGGVLLVGVVCLGGVLTRGCCVSLAGGCVCWLAGRVCC